MSDLYRLVIKDGGVQWTPEEVIGDLIDEGVLVPVEGVLLTRAEAANGPEVRAMLDADYWLEVPTMSDRNLAGAWTVTSFNYDPVPEALFDNELEARRWADTYGSPGFVVDFWPFGVEWSERWKNGIDPWAAGR